jgi:uncharacterized protein
MDALDGKLHALREILRDLERVVVAFSGGVDSTFVLKAAIDELGADRALAVTSRSASVPEAEARQAAVLAVGLGVEHRFIETDEFDNPDYLRNPVNRCYSCKTSLYRALKPLIDQGPWKAIVNGANVDDLSDHRPGLVAAGEFGVRSPAAESGLTKLEIRELSRRWGLPTADKPAAPCLSSRLPYGEAITVEKLRMVERGEAFLHRLGLANCRVRHHGNLARIEVPTEWFETLAEPRTARTVHDYFQSLGYAYVALDLRGLRSGSLNEVLSLGGARK